MKFLTNSVTVNLEGRNIRSAVQPTGWALRAAFPDRWLRIHSLANSRRYAETEEEWGELRSRHRHATSFLFCEGQLGFLIVPWMRAPDGVFRELGLTPSQELPGYQPDDDEPPNGPFHIAPLHWSFDSFLPILEAVANDATRAVFVSADTARIYAPYDGGADLFFPAPDLLPAARTALADYLSGRADGL
ncbi:MAG: hypothetical protein V4726_06050 [Verrucomicrobiota bacterium]